MLFFKNNIKKVISLAFFTCIAVLVAANSKLVDSNNDIIDVAEDYGHKVKEGAKDIHKQFFDRFSESDLHEFLKDHNIPMYTGKSKDSAAENLKEYCSEKWDELFSPEGYENTDYSSWFAHLKDIILPSHKSKPEQIIDDLKDKVSQAADKVTGNDPKSKKIDSSDIADWLFNSWDITTLKSFLKENKIYIAEKLYTKDELIKICKDHFGQLNTYLKASGYYVSDKYFSKWTKEDLQKWLKTNKIHYKVDSQLEDLKKLVRANIYKVSTSMQQIKYNLFDNLDLEAFGGKLLSTKESVDDKIHDLLENLSKPDLLKWLKLHDIDLKGFNINDDKEFVEKFKKEHYIDYLTSDVTSYLKYKQEQAAKTGDSLLSKSSKQIESQYENYKDGYDNAVEKASNKLDDFSSWSLESLQDFEAKLNKDFGFHKKKLHNNKEEIIKYVQSVSDKHKDKFGKFYKTVTKDIIPDLKDSASEKVDGISDFFENWSFENLQKWVNDGISSADDQKTLVEKAKQKFIGQSKSSSNNVKNFWDSTFNSWSKEDLKSFLDNLKTKNLLKSSSPLSGNKGFGSMSKEDLYEICKDNTLWLLTAGTYKREQDKSYWEKSQDAFSYVKDKIPYIKNI